MGHSQNVRVNDGIAGSSGRDGVIRLRRNAVVQIWPANPNDSSDLRPNPEE